jgi:hypothetical protein
MKTRILLLVGLLLPLLGSPQQVSYKATKRSDGTQVVRKESVPGSGVFDVVVSSLPSDATRARNGGRVLIPYALEDKRQLNLTQFGTGKYFSPNYRFGIDFNFNLPVAQRRARGETLFSTRSLLDGEFRSALQFGEGMIMAFDGGINGPYEGTGFYEASLSTMEAFWQGTIEGASWGWWVPNIETSNEWYPGNASSPLPGYPYGSYGTAHSPSWESSQNKSIQLESTGETITIGQLAARGVGSWEAEKSIRRSNRLSLILTMAKQRSPAAGRIAYGASMYQAEPRMSQVYSTQAFNDGNADVSKIGGDGNGNITINGRQYNLKGSFYGRENFMLDYYYRFYYELSESALQAVFVNQTVRTYPEFWGLMTPRHVVADQKGHWQANRYRMINRGEGIRGTLCMREPMFEGAFALVNGQLRQESARVPGSFGTGCLDFGDGGSNCDDMPKPWIPPYEMYSYYMTHRFLEGGTPNSGFYLFNAPAKFNPDSEPGYNQVYHSITSLFQARADLQPYEVFFDNSTLVQDPEVKVNEQGDFQSYDGAQAYNYDSGVFGTQRPAYSLRYQQTGSGWRVLIMGGMNQGWGQERTDIIRVPGLFNGNSFRVKLRGPSAQVYEFAVSNQDSNQTYQAVFNTQASWEKAGYAGRVN